ncbi:MAG TPA: rod shape-determining protein MreD, partial [Streptosporangiaceae bacterium]|nr:rod shape-determining protein MreD [Streptosporangiaceae bacterium]
PVRVGDGRRLMVRWLISFVVVAVTVIVQVTIVDRIAFPGGTGPDLVLLVVAALALAGGPLAGALIGFSAGLALDIAPPGSHLVGQDALVFCLVGYLCGLAAEVPSGDGVPEQGHTALFEIVVTAAGAVCGEALGALLGVMLSDPRVTWPAVKHVLPVAVVYDVVLAPFVLFGVAAALRLAGRPRERAGAVWSGVPARTAAPSAAHGAIRQVNGGNTPRLRLSERAKGEGWVSGARGALAQGVGGRPAARREPRLNLARSGSPSRGRPAPKREPRLNLARSGSPGRGRPLAGSALGAAFATSGLGGGPAKVKFASRRYEGVLGGSWLGTVSTTSGLAGSRLTSSRFGRSRMGRSLFGGSVFSRSPSALSRPAPRTRPAALGRSSFLGRPSLFGRSSPFGGTSSARRKAGLLHSAPRSSAAGHAPRFARRGTLAGLTGALRRSTRRRPTVHQPTLRHTTRRQPSLGVGKSPGRGWLRGTRGTSSRQGGLGRGGRGGSTARLGTGGPARLHMPRPRVKRRRRTGGYR